MTKIEIVVSYDVVLANSVIVNSTVSTDVALFYQSSSANPQNIGAIRFFNTSTEDPLVQIAAPEFALVLNATALVETLDIHVVVGEAVSLLLQFTLPQGSAPESFLQISLPSGPNGLDIVATTVRNMQSNIVLANGSVNPTLTDSDSDSIDDAATFNFGNMTNIPEGQTKGPGDTVTVEVIAVVGLHNVNGTVLNVVASFQYLSASGLVVLPEQSIPPHYLYF